MNIAGVDGCRGGWLCIEKNEETLHAFIFNTFIQLLGSVKASVIAVDIPIGLPESGNRTCDILARRRLRAPRASSVFPTPVRDVIEEKEYALASEKHRKIDGRGISKQTFSILPKIREVDAILQQQPIFQRHIFEVHPEVCFAEWNDGIPMKSRKSKREDRFEREKLIEECWPKQRYRLNSQLMGAKYQPDDLNDAFASLWTADRIATGKALVLPEETSTVHDQTGLRMVIWV